MKIKRCKGDYGSSSVCSGCLDQGKPTNLIWINYLYKIEGKEGYYCKDCCCRIVNEEKKKKRMIK